jgi:hypothetical protein
MKKPFGMPATADAPMKIEARSRRDVLRLGSGQAGATNGRQQAPCPTNQVSYIRADYFTAMAGGLPLGAI